MNFSLTLAARYLFGRKLRTLLTTLAVVFGVLVLFAMNIFLPTMLAAMQANVMAAEGYVDLTITHVTGGPFDAAVADRVKAVEGVRAASATLQRTINLPADFYDHNPAKPDRVTALALIGVEPYNARSVRAYAVVAGRYLEAGDTAAALISQTLADALRVGVGDTFPIPTTGGVVQLTVAGLLPPKLEPGNEAVLVTLPQAQAMAGQPGRVNVIEVTMSSMEANLRTAIAENVQAALGPDYETGPLLGGADGFAASIQIGQLIINVFGVLALFMGAFIIFNTFRTVVAERRRDIGMLRAIGANRRTIFGLIVVECLVQGALGTAAGLALGYLVGAGGLRLLAPLISQFLNLEIGGPVVSPSMTLAAILLGMGVTVLAGVLPAFGASRVMPLEALRPSAAEGEFRRQRGPSFVAGVAGLAFSLLALLSGNTALVGTGAVLFLVGLVLVAPALVHPLVSGLGWLTTLVFRRSGTGRLARGNLARQPARTAITASTSMLGLAVVVAAGGLVASMSVPAADIMARNLSSDYLFLPPAVMLWDSDIGASPELAERLRKVDGVAEVSTLRFARSAMNGLAVSVLGIDPAVFPKVAGLRFQDNLFWSEAAAYQALAEERALIVNGAFLLQVNAKVGDTVRLATPKGVAAYRVVAAGTDLYNAKVASVFLSQANLLADFGKAEDVYLQLNLKPGADARAAEQGIRAIADAYPQFSVISGRAYYQTLLAQMNGGFAGMYVVLAILALPSLIAMTNTLAIGVIERTREIGMLRAVGGSRQQVQRLVLGEALALAAIGIALGLLAGLYLGNVMVAAMSGIFPLGYAFPVAGIVAAVAIGLLFGALAAVIPARQAARLDIVEALRYE